MNESWSTMPMTTAMLSPHKRPEEVSSADLNSLLRGRRFGNKENEIPMEMNPAIPEYDETEMNELQEFCRQRGIIGVNFNGMRPSAVLQMLKGKMGMAEQTVKRGLING